MEAKIIIIKVNVKTIELYKYYVLNYKIIYLNMFIKLKYVFLYFFHLKRK
jgi:hypothetical protein